jgi:hypothetical protein
VRTPQAQAALEIAFMLLCFRLEGAELDPLLLGWARKTLWQNGEDTPGQLRARGELAEAA